MSRVEMLAIGAHPDDVELSCAGTILAMVAKGKKVAICDLTQGELGTRGTVDTRYEEASEASRILKVTDRVNLKFPDGFFDGNMDQQRDIIRVIRHFKPRIVVCNAVRDRHPDHGRASELVSKCCFLAGLRQIGTQYEGEIQEPHRPEVVYHYIQDRWIEPDVVVDISSHFDQKIEAIKAYKTQFYDPKSEEPETPISGKEFLDFLEGRALQFGRTAGFKYGEGFTTERPLGISSLDEAL